MRENRGLSLVELLITIAILSIVLAAATSFMITGSRSFAKGNADSELQKEAELTVNQVEDMIIDVNGGMKVSDDQTEVAMYHAEIVGPDTVYTGELVRWNQSEQKLYYDIWTPDYDESTKEDKAKPAVDDPDKLLAENVAAFEVELDTTDETMSDGTVNTIVRSVQIRVGYENSNGRVDYATSPVITLRNRMLLSGNVEEIFADFQPPSDTMKLYYDGPGTLGTVPIRDRYSEVQRGSAYNIYAKLSHGLGDSNTEINLGDVSHLVNWELETKNTMSTIDANGYLTVGAIEPNDYLTITARYKSNPSKKASGIVKVVGGSRRSFEAIRIIPKSLEPFNPKYASNPTFSEGLTYEEEEELYDSLIYKWTVSQPQLVENFDDSKDTLELNVKKESNSYDQVFDIILTAYCPITNETREDKIQYRVDSKGTVGGDSNMKRGLGVRTGDGSINYTFDKGIGTFSSYDYDCYFCDIYGEKITADNDAYGDSIVFNMKSPWTAYYTLTFDAFLPPHREFYVKVVVNFYNEWNNTSSHYERIHYIPAVQLYDQHRFIDGGGANFEFYYGLVGFETWSLTNLSDFIVYEFVEFEKDAPQGVDVTASVVQDEIREGNSTAWARGVISDGVNVGWLPNNIKPLYMRIKIYFKDYPDIYTFVTYQFNR